MLQSFQTTDFPKSVDITELQSNVVKALRPVLRVPFLDGIALTNVVIGMTVTPISHTLGRAVLGFWITDITSGANVWRVAGAQVPASILPLQASSLCTVSLWVF